MWLKTYGKALAEHIKENDPAQEEPFKKALNEGCKNLILNKFSDFRFFQGENMDADGMLILLFHKENNPDPFLYYFKGK